MKDIQKAGLSPVSSEGANSEVRLSGNAFDFVNELSASNVNVYYTNYIQQGQLRLYYNCDRPQHGGSRSNELYSNVEEIMLIGY
ncbi:hypothetical protein KL938_000529 [Ogataea parapolymorpha]|nr:hypothetical protein KL938_000529 [Ogataea parapolymorpha]